MEDAGRKHLMQVKYLAAILYSDEEVLEKALELLKSAFSQTDYRSQAYGFSFSDYYEEEMGSGLKRVLVSFERPGNPGFLAQAKLICRELEKKFSTGQKRSVNLDIGYMDLFKVVLASFKGRGNKVYLSQGVWADIVLYFESGDYETFLWGFPDFAQKTYNEDLKQIRRIYKQQLKG